MNYHRQGVKLINSSPVYLIHLYILSHLNDHVSLISLLIHFNSINFVLFAFNKKSIAMKNIFSNFKKLP